MIALAPSLDVALTPALEAHEPPEARGLQRDQVRMLVSNVDEGAMIDTQFAALPDFLVAGDVLVVNTSATLPAALQARTPDGRAIGLHISTSLPAGLDVVEPRATGVDEGQILTLPGGARAKLLVPYRESKRLWIALLQLPEALAAYLARWGSPISYPYVSARWPIESYQTVFALHPGSAEMPSAGRPFSAAVLQALVAKGVVIARVTLHCGVASLEHDEPPYEEFFSVSAETAAAVNDARHAGRRVLAVGTTVARALESALDEKGRVVAARGWTNHIISPINPVRSFDAILTGFHEPRSTHLALLQGLHHLREIERAYRHAVAEGYLWHEFGDVHLIL